MYSLAILSITYLCSIEEQKMAKTQPEPLTVLTLSLPLSVSRHFQNTDMYGSESMSSSMRAGCSPARQQISSMLCCPV